MWEKLHLPAGTAIVALLLGGLLGSGCGAPTVREHGAAPTAAEAQVPPPSKAGNRVEKARQGDDVETIPPTDLFSLLDRLLLLPRLSRDAVGEVLGPRLEISSGPHQRYFDIHLFRAESDTRAPIVEAELRSPGRTEDGRDGLLIVTVNPALEIEAQQVVRRYGAEPEVRPALAEVPLDQPRLYLRYRHPGGALSFGMSESGRLMAVVIDRTDGAR